MQFHYSPSALRIVLLLVGCLLALPVLAGVTTRVSVASDGTQGNNMSGNYIAMSADGCYTAFCSIATNLVPGDTNNGEDIFAHNNITGQTERVSVASDGTQGNDHSGDNGLALSADGRYVAFTSCSSNLVHGDTNSSEDIFVHDRITGQTERVDVKSNGTQVNSQNIHMPSLSADGRYVAYASDAPNLVSGDQNGRSDIFVYDRQTGQTKRVSVASDGTEGNNASDAPSFSADGHYVIFDSDASNLVSEDTNSVLDVFVHNLLTGQTERVSVASDSTQGNKYSAGGTISTDGHYIAFYSYATNLVPGGTNGKVHVFARDTISGETKLMSVASDGTQANNDCVSSVISADGHFITFYTFASNLVPEDTNTNGDIFVHDTFTGRTERVSVTSDGLQVNRNVYNPSINADGQYVAYVSYATNLVPGDTNGTADVFVRERDRPLSAVALSSLPPSPQLANTPITLTATPTGGDIVENKFRCGYQDTTGWHWADLTNYQTLATCAWKPDAARLYTLLVYAREVGSAKAYDVLGTASYRIALPLSSVNVSVSPHTPQVLGTPVTITASHTGGANLEYLFKAGYQDAAGWHWSIIRDYASATTCTWTATVPHLYTILVYARETGSTAAYQKYATFDYRISAPAITATTLTALPATPQKVNTPITLTSGATGGYSVEYKFKAGYQDAAGWHWSDLTNYQNVGSCIWTPAIARTYTLLVYVREVGSTLAYQKYATLSYKVTAQ